MGYSITWEKHERLEALKKEGRLCMMDRPHVTRATTMVKSESWPYELGEPGTGRVDEMPFCTRHARTMPVGYEGGNFRVLEHRRF